MRITRFFPSLFAVLVAATAVAGCALQPASFDVAAADPPAHAMPAAPSMPAGASGIDNMYYGNVAAPPPSPALAAAAPSDRGLFTTGSVPDLTFASAAAPADPAAYAPAPAPAEPATYASAPADRPYTLDSGDRLRIVVFGQDGISNSYLVDASGYIDMPLIGSVLARDLTTGQLASRIAAKLQQGYVKDPHVAVEVEAYRPFFILGEVAQPGQYPYVADMTVETAVAIAGGFSPRAYRNTVNITRVVHGREVRMKVPAGYPVRPGDTINVQERWF